MLKIAVPLLCLGFCLAARAQSLPPFGTGVAVPPPAAIKAANVKGQAIDCLTPADAALWVVENPQAGQTAPPFALEQEGGKNVLRIVTNLCDPARTTVRALLPGDGPANGDVWAKNQASYISFLCKSSKPAQMTCHLLQRGKTAGTYQTGFSAEPGEWQRVILPITQFTLKSFGRVAGVGFRVASAELGAVVSIADLNVGAMAYNDDSWKSQRLTISINGEWRFAVDKGDEGAKGQWYADKFDDSSWKVLKSGLSWQDQGIDHSGWGWYRQQIFIPKEFAGTPLQLTFCADSVGRRHVVQRHADRRSQQ